MAELVADCPRCGSNMITFDLTQAAIIEQQNTRQNWYEAFCVCRQCSRSTIFTLAQAEYGYDYVQKTGLINIPGSVNRFVDIKGYISLKDLMKIEPPEHIPNDISVIFHEGATCLSLDCNNAACTMFLLCIDKATKELLPKSDVSELNDEIRCKLNLRLSWLFDNGYLPEVLRNLSTCIKDNNDDSYNDDSYHGLCHGLWFATDAEDLLDFTCILLERIYTEPERLKVAQERRDQRHAGNNSTAK